MEIILLKDVEKVGYQYQIKKVKDGFGNNFLIPQGFALVANDSNRRKYASIVRALDKRESSRLDEYKVLAAKIEGQTVTISAKARDRGKLFGSVDAGQISKAIEDKLGVVVERKKISVENIKELGTHEITIHLHKEVPAKMNVQIISNATEAK